MSRPMGKPTICIVEKKGADQFRRILTFFQQKNNSVFVILMFEILTKR